MIRSKGGGTDTTDATATAAQIDYGYTAYAGGLKITGNNYKMPASIPEETVVLPDVSASATVA